MSSYEPSLSETANDVFDGIEGLGRWFPRYHEALQAVIDHVASECGELSPRGENEWAPTFSDCPTQILKIVKAQS